MNKTNAVAGPPLLLSSLESQNIFISCELCFRICSVSVCSGSVKAS